MSFTGGLVPEFFSLLQIAVVLIALWMALRFEQRVASLLQVETGRPLSKGIRTITWLSLGSILTLPLFDFVAFARELLEIISPATFGLAQGTVTTTWGNASAPVFDVLSVATTLAIYTTVWLLLWPHLRDRAPSFLASLAPSKVDRRLLTFSAAGLVNLMATSTVVGVVFVQLPLGIGQSRPGAPGLVVGWLLGLLLAAGLAVLYNLRAQQEGSVS